MVNLVKYFFKFTARIGYGSAPISVIDNMSSLCLLMRIRKSISLTGKKREGKNPHCMYTKNNY
jgi:hypothetical protein